MRPFDWVWAPASVFPAYQAYYASPNRNSCRRTIRYYKEIGQGAGHDQATLVLLEPAVAHLGEAEHVLDNSDRMLDFGPHLRFAAVLGALHRVGDELPSSVHRTRIDFDRGKAALLARAPDRHSPPGRNRARTLDVA
jgi:hypothetical protein